MADKEDVNRWKDEYGSIFSAHLAGVDYIFRPLKYSEYLKYSSIDSAPDREDYIVSVGLLDPVDVDFDDQPAGVVSTLVEEIFEVSGFLDPKMAIKILEEKREDAAQVWGLMKSFVLATMPAYREEELDELTFSEMAQKVALAEGVIRVNQAVFGIENDVTLDLIDPEEEEMRAQAEAQKHATQKKPGQAGYHDPIAQKLHSALGEV